LRTQDQNDDHDGVDDEGPEFWHVILARDVGDADQQRGGEGTGDARGAADRHHDQEVDHVFERKGRIEAENLGAERAAESGEARPDGKRQAEDRVDVDAEPAGDARVVDRGAQSAAETGAGQNELQADREQPADHDDEQSVASDADAEYLEAALQHARDLDEDLLRAHHVVDGGDRHEDEADGEQHLVEVALAVDVHIERALEQRPDQRGGDEGDGKPGEERQAGAVDQDQRDVAARHGERAVGEIDEIHQPERDRKPACQHEQQHAVGDPVEQNGQHGSSPRRRSYTDGGTGSDASRSRSPLASHASSAGLNPTLGSSLPGIARRKTRVNALMTRRSISFAKTSYEEGWT